MRSGRSRCHLQAQRLHHLRDIHLQANVLQQLARSHRGEGFAIHTLANRRIHQRLRLFLDPRQVGRTLEALGIELVDRLRARRPRREPPP